MAVLLPRTEALPESSREGASSKGISNPDTFPYMYTVLVHTRATPCRRPPVHDARGRHTEARGGLSGASVGTAAAETEGRADAD